MNIDLGKLTDGQLRELEKIIEPDRLWDRLREIAEVEGLPSKAKEMIGDLMLSIYEDDERGRKDG